ncbi:MAG: chorismate-binding protein [Solirubrobacteraceae bacterium]
MPVKPTAAPRRGDRTVTLLRERLPCALSPAAVLQLLGDQPLPFALIGRWAGGGAIVGSDPLAVADDDADPFAVLDDQPSCRGIPGDGLAGDDLARGGVTGGAPRERSLAVGGGWFGWLGYRLGARIERVPAGPPRPVPLPDFHLAYYDNLLRLDGDGRWWFEALVGAGREQAIASRRAALRELLSVAPPAPGGSRRAPAPRPLALDLPGAAHHLDAVADCVKRIAAGEIFQANICLRLESEWHGTAGDLLSRALERITPPYAAAFQTPRGQIASLSPELFLRRRGARLTTGPIKGTIDRPSDPAAAAAALRRLRSSTKDAAEHVMIVDLMRNDLGRVCAYGSIEAPHEPTAEPHPGLWHLVSHVHGRLRPRTGDAEVLRATFPPGSVTGAPKVQALHVIAGLEPTGREVYTGAIGFASPLAGLELSVAIRTLEMHAGRLWLGAGGGIVADSDPRLELQEALAKARPIADSIGTSVVVGDRVAETPARGRGRRAA